MSKIPIGENQFGARSGPLIYIAALLLAAGFFSNLLFSNDVTAALLTIGALFTGIGVLSVLISSRIRLVLNDERLVHKNILRTKEIKWSQISKIDHRFVWHGKSGNNEFVITYDGGRQFSFHSGFFNRSALQQIAILMQTCCKNAVSEKVIQMANGVFPWHVR